ncbi:hypothetical protein FF38_03831 [Lucilia cuprina]|uniref:Uncharacterized protein n=1 Tax=Lucilia cuprina TaxID=7375 RepID=A0A0L0CMQ3_LUCCU|nr:hypothetical protein FF38_03831 [Lucilia cuprina]
MRVVVVVVSEDEGEAEVAIIAFADVEAEVVEDEVFEVLRTTSNFNIVHLVAVLVPAVVVIKVKGGEVALLAVEIVRTVVFEGKGNIEIEGTLVFITPAAATLAAVDRVSLLAAVVTVVVTWLSSPAAATDVDVVVVLSCPIGCWINTKLVFSVVVLSFRLCNTNV